MGSGDEAIRATARGTVQGVGYRWAVVDQARELGVLGWVRNQDDGSVLVHAEGSQKAVVALATFLHQGPPGAEVDSVDVAGAKVEGHEQFAIRGVAAGRFVVEEHAGETPFFTLHLEVDGGHRSWRLAKAPSMNPAEKRFAVATGEEPPATGDGRPTDPDAATGDGEPADPDAATGDGEPTDPDAATGDGEPADPGVAVWDAGPYEQGGRVAWPEAVERGHAVFVLHGERLHGGFALQRTRGSGPKAGWMFIKRRDEAAAAAGF